MAARLVGGAHAIPELMGDHWRAPIGDYNDFEPVRERERFRPRERARIAFPGNEGKRRARGGDASGAAHEVVQGSGARQLEAAAVALNDDLAAAGGSANGFFVGEPLLLGLCIERRSGRSAVAASEREQTVHEALVAA